MILVVLRKDLCFLNTIICIFICCLSLYDVSRKELMEQRGTCNGRSVHFKMRGLYIQYYSILGGLANMFEASVWYCTDNLGSFCLPVRMPTTTSSFLIVSSSLSFRIPAGTDPDAISQSNPFNPTIDIPSLISLSLTCVTIPWVKSSALKAFRIFAGLPI